MFGAATLPTGRAPSALSADEQPDFVTRTSRGLDWLIAQSGIPGVTEAAGRSFGGMFGMPELGAEIGKNFPRDVVNLLPAMASPLLGPAAPLGMAASAALSGASGYERSGGNVAAGLVSGALAPLTPVVGRAGGQLALKALGAPAVAETGKFVAGSVNQRIAQYLAENVAAAGLGEAGGQATSVASGQGLYNPVTPENIFSIAAGNLPFAVLDIPSLVSPLAKRPPPATLEMLHNMKKEVAATARQHPSDRLRIDEDGNVEVIGLDGQVERYTNLSEANMALRQVREAPLAFSLPEEVSPLTTKEKLDILKTSSDASEKIRRLQELGAGSQDMERVSRLYLDPEAQDKLASGMTPGEAVSRFLNKMTADADQGQSEAMLRSVQELNPEYQALANEMLSRVMAREGPVEAGRTIMDYTPNLYATLLKFQEKGIPASQARINQQYIWGNPEEKRSVAERSRLEVYPTEEEAIAATEELNRSNPDKFTTFYTERLKSGDFQVRSRTSRFRPLLDNVDVRMMSGNDPDELLQRALEGLDLGEVKRSVQRTGELQEQAKTSRIAEGFLQNVDEIQKRQRNIIQSLPPSYFVGGRGLRGEGETPEMGARRRDQARILFEAEANRDSFEEGELPTIRPSNEKPGFSYVPAKNVDKLVQLMADAGVPFEYNPNQKARDVNAEISRIYGKVYPQLISDPILARLQDRLGTLYQYARQAEPGGESQEYRYVSDRAKDFYAKAKMLGRKVEMSVVDRPEDLREMLETRFGQEKGIEQFNRFMTEAGGRAEGYYDEKNKMIALVADNIIPKEGENYVQAVDRVLWHEAAGHFGLQSVLGNEYIATLRRTLSSVPRDERESIARLYTKGDLNNPIVAAEYLARMAETNPGLGVVQEFYSRLRTMARAVGKDLDFTDNDMKLLVKRSRDYLFKNAGIFRPGTSSQGFREGGLGPEPNPLESSSMDYSMAAPYLSPGTGIGLSTAWDAARIGAQRRGLDPSEAANQAYRTMGQIRSGDAVGKFRWDETQKRFIAPGQAGRFIILEPAGSPRGTMSRMIQAQSLHDGFLRSLRGDFNKVSPVIARRDELSAWASRLEQEYRDSVLTGLAKIVGAGTPAPALDPGDFPQAVAAWAANAITAKGPAAFEEIARYAPKPVAELVRLLVKENIEDSRSALGVRQAEELGITTGRIVSAEQKQALEGIMDLQPSVRSVDEESDRVGMLAQKMVAWTPEVFDGLMFSKPLGEESPKDLQAASARAYPSIWHEVPTEFPQKPSLLDRSFQLASNLGEKYPELYPFLRTARGHRAMGQNAAKVFLEEFGWEFKNGVKVPKSKNTPVEVLARNANQRKGLNILGLRQNELIDSETPRKLTMAEINELRSTMPAMSDADFQNVTTVFEQSQRATARSRETILSGRAANLAHSAISILGQATDYRNMTGLMEFKNELAKWISDPAANPLDLPRYQAMLGPDEVGSMMSWLTTPLAEGIRSPIESFRRQQADYRARDGYLPEVRYGPYKMTYKQTSDGKIATIAAMSEADVQATKKRLIESGEAEPDSVRYHKTADVRASNLNLGSSSLERAMEIEDEVMTNKLIATLGKEDFEAYVKPFYEPVKAAMQVEVEKSMPDYMKRRGLKAGRESLDFLDTLMNYGPAVAYGSARSHVKRDASFYMHDPRLANQPELRALGKSMVENALSTASGGEKAMKEIAFQYFMALNPSTMVMELTQSLSTLVPWLTRHGAGFGGAYRELMKAYQTIGKAKMRNRYDDADLGAAVQRASDEGIIDRGLWQEYEDPHRDMIDSIRDATASRQVAKSAVDYGKMYLQMSRGLYGMAAQLNNQVGFVAGYNRGKKMGLKGNALYDFAARTTSSTMFSGGRANRAVGLHSAEGPFVSTLASTFGALQSYFFGMVGTMGRSIKEAYRETKGEVINPNDRYAARKAMAQLFGHQLAMAGVLGMPGVTAAMAVLEQMFPEAELQKGIQEVPQKIFGDSDFSRWVGDSLLLGAPTASLPIDVSARIGLSNVLGISSLDGFSAAQLAGPVGSIVSNAYTAAQTLQRGGLSSDNWFLAGQQAAPVWAKNVLKWWKDDGVVRDYSGNVITELSNTENVLQGLGFRPKVVAQIQTAQRLAKRAEAASQHREQAMTRDLAQGMLSADSQGVVNRLSQRLSAEPTYDVRAAAKRAARKAVDMTMPATLGRGGTLRSAEDISKIIQGVAPLAPKGPSEMDRLMAQQAYLWQLGIPGLGVPSAVELRNAMMADALRSQNPEMTPDEARLALAQQRAMGRAPLVPTDRGLGPMF